jgi:hypothetical protein
MARVVEGGTKVQSVTRSATTPACACRLDAAVGPERTGGALIWRKVFPGDIRDMVLSTSRDGGRSFGRRIWSRPITGASQPARIAAAPWASTDAAASMPPGTRKARRRARSLLRRLGRTAGASDRGAGLHTSTHLDSRPRAHGRRSRRRRWWCGEDSTAVRRRILLPLHRRRRTDLQRRPDALHGHPRRGSPTSPPPPTGASSSPGTRRSSRA